MKRLLSISFIAIVVDQIVKLFVSTNMALSQSITIIDKFFYLTYVHNTGAAWSILSGNRWPLVAITILALFIIYFVFIKDKQLKLEEEVTYGLLVGGIIGNLIDRVIHGYVIDYLDFYIFKYDYPIFNVADICIVVSVIMLVYLTFKGENYDNSRGKRKKN